MSTQPLLDIGVWERRGSDSAVWVLGNAAPRLWIWEQWELVVTLPLCQAEAGTLGYWIPLLLLSCRLSPPPPHSPGPEAALTHSLCWDLGGHPRPRSEQGSGLGFLQWRWEGLGKRWVSN